jgi:AcrR family transcriptional regulator
MKHGSSMEKVKRKEREVNRRRVEILKQAVKIFAAKGFHNTTVAEIAEASGFAIGTLYQVFESKEQLYRVMLAEKLDMMYSAIQKRAAKEADFLRKIEVMVASHFQFVENNTDFCRIFVRGDHLSLPQGNVELRKRMTTDYAVHVSFIEEVMREGMRRGVLKRMDPVIMAAAFTGIVNSCISKWLTMVEETSLQGKAPIVIEIFLNGVGQNAH